jgi:hypothetical protein
MASPEPPLPTFLIIGAQKSATRWLRANLGKHPDIYTPDVEIMYFSNPKYIDERGPGWYRAQFADWGGVPIVGEATPSYMAWPRHPPRIAPRVKDLLPDVRLIALLRNPVDRAYSALLHHVKHGRFPADADLVEIATTTDPNKDRLGIVGSGWYGAALTPYREIFGDQLRVFLYEEVRAQPEQVYGEALRHIGADRAEFLPTDLREVVYSNRERGEGPPPPTLEQRRRLYELFRDDLRLLERVIDRDLSMWDPGAA